VNGDRPKMVQVSRAERDRRDVPFAGGPKAQDEAHRSRRKVGLVRVRHDRGIEQRRRFERVLVREIGAEKQLPLLGKPGTGPQPGSHLLETPPQEFQDLHVTIAELGFHLRQQRCDLALGKCHHHGPDVRGALPVGGMERPGQHSRAIRMENEVAAGDGDGAHGAGS